jgi:hypothetical protein
MRLKRWESPRREGRNDKGKKSAARQRQIKKQTQVLRRKLKGEGERSHSLLSFWAILPRSASWPHPPAALFASGGMLGPVVLGLGPNCHQPGRK